MCVLIVDVGIAVHEAQLLQSEAVGVGTGCDGCQVGVVMEAAHAVVHHVGQTAILIVVFIVAGDNGNLRLLAIVLHDEVGILVVILPIPALALAVLLADVEVVVAARQPAVNGTEVFTLSLGFDLVGRIVQCDDWSVDVLHTVAAVLSKRVADEHTVGGNPVVEPQIVVGRDGGDDGTGRVVVLAVILEDRLALDGG